MIYCLLACEVCHVLVLYILLRKKKKEIFLGVNLSFVLETVICRSKNLKIKIKRERALCHGKYGQKGKNNISFLKLKRKDCWGKIRKIYANFYFYTRYG
jgi:hypothetical protein